MGVLRVVRIVKHGGWSLWSLIWKWLRSFELMSSHRPQAERIRVSAQPYGHIRG